MEPQTGHGGSGADLPYDGGKPNLGAPRIHGELLMLGFDASERTISRWMKRAPRDPQPAQSPDRDAGSWPVSSGTHHEHCVSHESRDN